jgi:uncharacterized protein YndB with AHSA1/START domain
VRVENPDGTQVYASRRFDEPASRLWRAFTDPGDMAAWMWTGYARNCVAESDLRVGGRYSVYTDSNATADGWHTDRIGRLGIYVDIVPEKRLVFTLHWDAPVGYNQRGGAVTDEVVLVTFRPSGDSCVVELRHVGIPDDGVSAVEHRKAVAEEFEFLARLVEARGSHNS